MFDFESIAKIVLSGILGVMILHSIYGAIRSILASRWPKVSGQVTYAGILEDDDGEGATFLPVIEFKYVVRGKEYTSDNFAFGFAASGFRFLSSGILKKYANWPRVKVYYNPKRPSESVLLTGLRFFHVFNLALFLGVAYLFRNQLGL